jgi:hypothetical protein
MKAISTLLTVMGMLITTAGSVALVWLEVDSPYPGGTFGGSYRWQIAMAPLFVIAIGLVLIAAAQILRVVAARFEDQPAPTARTF